MKTVRFTAVVERCGRPQVHVLWTAPERDPEFQRALKADRVMTVAPAAPGHAEVGQVGFDPHASPGVQLLVFPKSLKRFAATRIVGIKFELVEQPSFVTAKPHEGWTKRRHEHRKPPAHGRKRNGTSEVAFERPPAPEPSRRPDRRVSAPSPASRHPPPTSARPSRAPKQRSSRRTPLPTSAPEQPSSAATPLEALTTAARTALAELERGEAGDAYQTLKHALGLT